MLNTSKILIITLFVVVSSSVFAQQSKEKRMQELIRWAEEYDGINLKAGMDTLEKALLMANENQNVHFQAKILMRMINYVTSRLNNFDKASECVAQLGELSRNNPSLPYLRSEYHNGLGCLFYYENIDRKRASAEFEKAIKIVRDNGLDPGYSLLNNYALALQSNGQYQQAMDNFKKSQKIYNADTSVSSHSRFLLKSTLNIAICKINLAEHDSAEYYFRKGLEIAEKTEVLDDDFQANVYLGVFLHEHFRPDEALEYFNISLPLVEFSKSFENRVYLFQSLADIYLEKRDYLKAHQFRKEELVCRDSLRSRKIMEKALSMDYRFELDSLEHQKQYAEIQMQTERERYKVHAFAIISLLILVVSVATFWLYRLHKQKQLNAIRAQNEAMEKEIIKQQAELELLKKEEELIASNIQLTVREGDLQNIKGKLQEHVQKSGDPQFEELRKVLAQVKSSEKKSDHLKSINNLISSTKTDFYRKVKARFPSLTDDEMRLVMLLRLNLSSDELIMLFNISRSSLNTKRYRLRKKIGLNTSDSLEDFILNL